METKYSDKLLGFLWDKTSTFFCNFFVLLLRKKIDKQNKKDWKEHGDFPNTFRFIVDFTRLQNGGEFERSFREIYRPELQLKKEKDNNR